MENMKAVYLEEANELLTNLESALLQLDETPDEKSLIEEVFRIMHTLKGNSSMFGFANIAEFIHNLETVYDLIRSGKQKASKALIDVTLASMDHIKQIVSDPDLSDSSNKEQHESLTVQILDITGSPDTKEEVVEENKVVAPKEDNTNTFYIHYLYSITLYRHC